MQERNSHEGSAACNRHDHLHRRYTFTSDAESVQYKCIGIQMYGDFNTAQTNLTPTVVFYATGCDKKIEQDLSSKVFHKFC